MTAAVRGGGGGTPTYKPIGMRHLKATILSLFADVALLIPRHKINLEMMMMEKISQNLCHFC